MKRSKKPRKLDIGIITPGQAQKLVDVGLISNGTTRFVLDSGGLGAPVRIYIEAFVSNEGLRSVLEVIQAIAPAPPKEKP